MTPHVIDLLDIENDTWMNRVSAERLKGSPLSKVELARLLDGKKWNGAKDSRDNSPRPADQD